MTPQPKTAYLGGRAFRVLAAFSVFVLVALSACATNKDSTSFSGLGPQDGGDRILAVPLFENETFEPILERALTQIFKETLLAQGWTVAKPNHANTRVLRGRIVGFGLRPIALNPVGVVREYRVEIVLALRLLREAGGPEALSLTLQGRADYLARPDPAGDRLAKDRAIREAGRGMAEQLAAALQTALDSKPERSKAQAAPSLPSKSQAAQE